MVNSDQWPLVSQTAFVAAVRHASKQSGGGAFTEEDWARWLKDLLLSNRACLTALEKMLNTFWLKVGFL